jgi:hypothetical protein
MQDVVDDARVPLNDEAKVRYGDDKLLRYANAGLRRIYTIRPDLRLGLYATPITDLALTDPFPLVEYYRQPLADFITFRAETVDDEHINSGRVNVFMQSFDQGLLS